MRSASASKVPDRRATAAGLLDEPRPPLHARQGRGPARPRTAGRRADGRGRTAAAPLIEDALGHFMGSAMEGRASLREKPLGWHRSGLAVRGGRSPGPRTGPPEASSQTRRGASARFGSMGVDITHGSRAASATEHHCRAAIRMPLRIHDAAVNIDHRAWPVPSLFAPSRLRNDVPTNELVTVGCVRIDYGSRTRKPIRSDGSEGPLVAGAGSDRGWPYRVRDLFVCGCGDGVRLPLHAGRRAIPLAVLLPGSQELGTARPVHVCVLRDLGAVGLPAHLLLLPQGVLPRVLPRPACVRGRWSEPRPLPR